MEEAFFSAFMEELQESLRNLDPPRPMSSWSSQLYLSKWRRAAGSIKPEGAVVACDGSISESIFSGGLTVWTARAVAHVYSEGGEVRSIPRVAVKIGYRLKGRPYFMKALELETLHRAVEEAEKEFHRVFALYDGSLYLRFIHHVPRLEAIKEIFQRYVGALINCLEIAQGEGVSMVGLSKDSDVSYLRARILLDSILMERQEIGEELRIERRSVKRMAERIEEIVKRSPEDPILRAYLEEFKLEVSDEALYTSLALEPGFTIPLLLAPQTQFITEEVRRGTRSWWESSFRKELWSRLEALASLLDEYYSQPPIAISYWKAASGQGVYRVDVPSHILGFKGRCGDLQEDEFLSIGESTRAEELIANLNWLTREPYAVSPLTEVDAIVRLDRSLYRQVYEPVIVEELKRRGFEVAPRKRWIRDLVLRGY
ncbi:MAG: DNA double-strand break repair nuclease NurA [Candidatus Bathyarchaeia archaeon]|nr:DNA double-strand break repair nuclease NurA [Candidatus Bathyarchaeota archaeon]